MLQVGTAVADFVIFPPRWIVAENTFRPPYFHRNYMSEFMGMIYGQYDAKEGKAGKGFQPGGSSLHSCMTAHGPDTTTFIKATAPEASLTPTYLDSGLAFMFETMFMLKLAPSSLTTPLLQKDYSDCWANFSKKFDGTFCPDVRV
jgi:homogentisate 1,2-dioxygenase